MHMAYFMYPSGCGWGVPTPISIPISFPIPDTIPKCSVRRKKRVASDRTKSEKTRPKLWAEVAKKNEKKKKEKLKSKAKQKQNENATKHEIIIETSEYANGKVRGSGRHIYSGVEWCLVTAEKWNEKPKNNNKQAERERARERGKYAHEFSLNST